MQVETSGLLACLVDKERPSLGYLFVGGLLVMPICLRFPVGQSVDEIGSLVQEFERLGRLSLVGWKELGCEIRQSVNESNQRFLDSIISVFGAGFAIRNGILHFLLISLQDLESRGD
jgi:hypothetical protein